MSVGVTIKAGSPGALRALKGPGDYSVVEDSTPIDIADTTGAAGQITITGMSDRMLTPIAAKRLYRKRLRVTDLGLGFTEGIVRVPSGGKKGTISLTADLRTALLVAQRTAQPFDGSVTGYVEYLLGLVDITDGYVIDPSFDAVSCTYPGWEGEVYLKMKQLCAAVGAELSLASGNIVFRPTRTRTALRKRDADVTWSVDDSNLALSVDGYWYEAWALDNLLVYPYGGWNEDVSVYTVDARETVEVDIPIDVSLSWISQPVVQDSVDRDYDTSSVYCVTGADGLPITAAQWTAAGGRLEVAIGEDTRSIVLTITGADLDQYAPFTIAATAGPSDTYSSLRLIGDGVTAIPHYVSRLTTVDPEIASQEVGATIDSPFVTSLEQLEDLLRWTRSRFSAPRQTITVRTKGINRQGESGSYAYPTFEDFNQYASDEGWIDGDDLNDAAPGLGWDTIQDFNDWWAATVADDFANQAFGNVAGARVFEDGLWFRIRSDTITADLITYTAENDTTADDFNVWATKMGWSTIDDFNNAWDGATFDDFNVAPLIEGF